MVLFITTDYYIFFIVNTHNIIRPKGYFKLMGGIDYA
jgi:hypothetical protein